MSTIKNGGHPVVLNGKEYSLLFSLNALEEIQDKFGGYDKLSEVFNAENPNWIKETKWLLTLLINEGILEKDDTAITLTEQKVGRMVHAGNLQDIQRSMFAAFANGTQGDDNDGKEDESEEEIEGNMKAVQKS